jgi:hypothetical protein
VTPPATTASLPRCRHGRSARLPLRESVPVPAWLASPFHRCRRRPFDPLPWRTRLGTSPWGYTAHEAPALPYSLTVAGREVLYTRPLAWPPRLYATVGVSCVRGVSGSTEQARPSSVRDVGFLGMWLPRTTRLCPGQACSHACGEGLSSPLRTGQDKVALSTLTSYARMATRPSAAPCRSA